MEQLFLPLLLMLVVAIPLVMGTRKQKRAAQEQQKLQSSLSEGDRVMTTSGLYGTVADTTSDTTIDIEIAPGVVTTWLRQAVREKVAPEVADEIDNDSDDDTVDTETVAEPVETPKAEADEKPGPQIAPPLEHEKK
ncbi:preprotein translocase subunit YajC [Amycolatopsis endophytica]|uniref:Preprotein translocase subunit YajC n=1 Tax=Amycolatopsis endophytica TaxID=860233 RepID=A0A853BDH2_9PSEU|nr:preprotein translocase subunit YajC [Amycolatopsis endophytica]NYI92486.1 preprotein translocase subunit YajC [Amycolatopsis endophytica]